jgi:hypothetical protein
VPLTALLVAAVLQAEDTKVTLPVPTWVYPLVVAIILLLLLLVTYAFRSVGKRH